MKQRGVTFTHSAPLFLQGKSKTAMFTQNIQKMMQELAVRSGFIDTQNNGHEFNPLGPHALRESFGSIMTNSGVPDTIVDFWLGHEIGEMAEAYKGVQLDSLKQMYLAREKLISISAQKVDVEDLKEKLKIEMEQQSRQLQLMVNSLMTENMDLKNRMQGVERKLSDIERTVTEMRKTLD
jgi:hypothetical protein